MILRPLVRSAVSRAVQPAIRAALLSRPEDPLGLGRFFLADATRGLNRMGHTRSGATYNPQADGSLLLSASDVWAPEWNAALGLGGFRVDPSWTQRLLYTHDFANAAWIKSNVALSSGGETTLGPDGVLYPAYAGASGTLLKRLRQNWSTTTIGFKTMTWLVRPGTESSADFRVQDGSASNGAGMRVNLTTGAVISAVATFGSAVNAVGRVTALANGCMRVDVTVELTAALTQVQSIMTWDLNGTTASEGTLYPMGCNLVESIYPVPIVVATSAAVTIGSPSITNTLAALGLSLPGDYGIYAEFLPADRSSWTGYPGIVSFDDGTSNNVARFYLASSGSFFVSEMHSGGVQKHASYPAMTPGQVHRAAFRVSDVLPRSCVNGVLSTADGGESGNRPAAPTRIAIGPMGGLLRKLAVFPYAPTDAQLQAVTT